MRILETSNLRNISLLLLDMCANDNKLYNLFLSVAGVVPKQKGKREETEKGCRKAEVGTVLSEHEEVKGQLQI